MTVCACREIYTSESLDHARQMFVQLTSRGKPVLMTSDSGFSELVADGGATEDSCAQGGRNADILSPTSPDEADWSQFDPQLTFRGDTQGGDPQCGGQRACSQLGRDMLQLYRTGEGADVLLLAHDQQFPAHR